MRPPTGTTTPGKSGPGSNGNEEVLHRASELEHHQIWFSDISSVAERNVSFCYTRTLLVLFLVGGGVVTPLLGLHGF